jgi:hypothetical protein
MSDRRSSYSRRTSRTWQPYSRADHFPGAGRSRWSPGPSSKLCQAAALTRIMSATPSRGKLLVSRPHSGQGRCSTQVQSLVSGSMVITRTVPITLRAAGRPCRSEGPARFYPVSSRSSVAGSAPATSSTFKRLRVPATRVTEERLTPNAAATKASAAAVALPSAARSLTRTTRASSWCPPTPGREDPGRTRTAIRTRPVCAPYAGRSAAALALRPSNHPLVPRTGCEPTLP